MVNCRWQHGCGVVSVSRVWRRLWQSCVVVVVSSGVVDMSLSASWVASRRRVPGRLRSGGVVVESSCRQCHGMSGVTSVFIVVSLGVKMLRWRR